MHRTVMANTFLTHVRSQGVAIEDGRSTCQWPLAAKDRASQLGAESVRICEAQCSLGIAQGVLMLLT